MSVVNNSAYGTRNPVFGVQQKPIDSTRNPNTRDNAQIGTIWINKLTNDFFVLTSIVAGIANWTTPSNGAGIFTSLEATTGNITADMGDIVATLGNVTAGAAISAVGNITSSTGDLVATIGAVSAGTTVTAGTDIISTAGNIEALDGDFQATDTAVGIGASSLSFFKSRGGAIVQNGDGLGSITFQGWDGAAFQDGAVISAVSDGTPGAGRMPADLSFFTAPDAVSASQLRVLIPADGGLVIEAPTTATTPPLVLPGPVNIYTGAGAPGNGLAINVGDLYINTTAATAATRLYIATGAGAWTNFTAAA